MSKKGDLLILGFESEERLKDGEPHNCDGCGRDIVKEPNMNISVREADYIVCPVCGQQALEGGSEGVAA